MKHVYDINKKSENPKIRIGMLIDGVDYLEDEDEDDEYI